MNRTATSRRQQAKLTPAEEAFYKGFSPLIIGQPKTGARVKLIGDHPHAGKSGEIIRWELVQLFRSEGRKPVIRCDDGMECFAMDPKDYQVIA